MDLKQAERNIRIVSLFSFISIPTSQFLYGPLIDWSWTGFPLDMFLPWIFSELESGSAENWWPLVIVIILTEFVYFNRSRVAAILLLAFYSYTQFFSYEMMSFVHYLTQISMSPIFVIIWFCFTLFCGLIFIQGIRGTFAYHRIKRQQPVNPEAIVNDKCT